MDKAILVAVLVGIYLAVMKALEYFDALNSCGVFEVCR